MTQEVAEHVAEQVREEARASRNQAIAAALDGGRFLGTAHRHVTPDELVTELEAQGYLIVPKVAQLTLIVWTDEAGDARTRIGLLDDDEAESAADLIRDQYGADAVYRLRIVRPITPMLPSDFLADWEATAHLTREAGPQRLK